MYIVSTRLIDKGHWTYFKVKDDVPQFFEMPGAKSDPGDLTDLKDATAGVEAIVQAAKAAMPLLPMIVIFVHGYNNTVKSATDTAEAIRTGLFNTGLTPAMVALCWSTDGKLLNYIQDRADARASAVVVGRMISAFAAHPDIKNGSVALNIITHSMGNYLLDFAMEHMAADGDTQPKIFKNSLLVAADINRDDLNEGQEGDARCRLSSRVVFYFDGWDGTLAAAEIVLHRQRFGMYGPHHWDRLYANTEGVACTDVIKAHTNNPVGGATEVGVGVHSGYFIEPKFFSDMADVFKGVAPDHIATRRQPSGCPKNYYRLK